MARLAGEPVRKLPFWVPLLGSAVIAFHLFAVLALALGAPSGPWPFALGVDMSAGPPFASTVNNVTYPMYLRPLGLSHNYHFLSNRTATDGVYFEVVLKNQDGFEMKRLKFPDNKANFWVHHRHNLLVQGLANDVPVPPRGPDRIAPKGAAVPKVDFWLMKGEVSKLVYPGEDDKGKPLPPLIDPSKLDLFARLQSSQIQGSSGNSLTGSASNSQVYIRISLPETDEGKIPPGRPMSRPSPWSLILVKAYLRHLCDAHNAHSAELIRHSKPAVLPVYAIMDQPPGDAFVEMIAHYGDSQRDFEEVQK